jgi:hypothetical protein
MDGSGGNVFDCPTSGNANSPPCGISYRYYSDDPGGNGAINSGLSTDGNPVFDPRGAGCYRADPDNSQNYLGQLHECGRPMYALWDAQREGGTFEHVGYYAAQSQSIEAAEQGNIFHDCGGTRFISCFDAADGEFAASQPNTPIGGIDPIGGLAPIPVPRVLARIPEWTYHLAWDDPVNWYDTHSNVDGTKGPLEAAPDPIVGLELYYHVTPHAPTDTELDEGAQFLRFFPVGTNEAYIDCEEIDPEICGLAGCYWTPVLKVRYRDSSDGTEVRSAYWSANGPDICCYLLQCSLLTRVVDFEARHLGKVRGLTRTEVSWETVTEDGLDGFVLERGGTLEGPWSPVAGFILPLGQGGEGASYAVDDAFKARGAREVFYRLQVHSDGQTEIVGPTRLEIPRGRAARPEGA